MVCQRSSNHKLKAIHNEPLSVMIRWRGVSKIVKSQIESNSQPEQDDVWKGWRCVKDRQITNWKQFTTMPIIFYQSYKVCQRSSNHKLKAIHNRIDEGCKKMIGVSKIVKSQIESNSQQDSGRWEAWRRCVKDRQITNWKQFTTDHHCINRLGVVCQRSSNHKLKAIHNFFY